MPGLLLTISPTVHRTTNTTDYSSNDVNDEQGNRDGAGTIYNDQDVESAVRWIETLSYRIKDRKEQRSGGHAKTAGRERGAGGGGCKGKADRKDD